jgi:hypothetical protein
VRRCHPCCFGYQYFILPLMCSRIVLLLVRAELVTASAVPLPGVSTPLPLLLLPYDALVQQLNLAATNPAAPRILDSSTASLIFYLTR